MKWQAQVSFSFKERKSRLWIKSLIISLILIDRFLNMQLKDRPSPIKNQDTISYFGRYSDLFPEKDNTIDLVMQAVSINTKLGQNIWKFFETFSRDNVQHRIQFHLHKGETRHLVCFCIFGILLYEFLLLWVGLSTKPRDWQHDWSHYITNYS